MGNSMRNITLPLQVPDDQPRRETPEREREYLRAGFWGLLGLCEERWAIGDGKQLPYEARIS